MNELQNLRNEILYLRNLGVLNKKQELSLINKINKLVKLYEAK